MKNQPNVLIIYPDQMRYDVMGCSGNSVIKTPHLDRLAAEGIFFQNAHNAFPLCCPFRASIQTGKYAHKHGMMANHYAIRLGQDFLAQRLKDHGYTTAQIGKWHLRGRGHRGPVEPGPRRLGYETFLIPENGHAYNNSIFYQDDGQPKYTGRYEPDYQTDHFIGFVEKNLESSDPKPFFACLCYGIPHFPNTGPDYWLKLYKPDEVEIPPDVPGILHDYVREFLAGYYGLVACLDYQVGRILSWLDHAGIAQNTMVILVSDHGDTAGQHGDFPFWKKSYYRSASHVPFIIRWPQQVQQNCVSGHLIDPSVDLYPTICQAAGIEIPDEVQGISFLPILHRPRGTAVRNVIYHQITRERQGPEAFPHPERGIRTAEWLYVEREGKPVALFDEKNDYHECCNLIDEPGYEEIKNQYRRRLYQEMATLDDDWDAEIVWPPEGSRNKSDLVDILKKAAESATLEITRDTYKNN